MGLITDYLRKRKEKRNRKAEPQQQQQQEQEQEEFGDEKSESRFEAFVDAERKNFLTRGNL